MKIEWAPKKTRLNLKKHEVAFEEAATVLSDPMAGVSARNRLLVVCHTDEGETIRLISARKASKGERELYEEG